MSAMIKSKYCMEINVKQEIKIVVSTVESRCAIPNRCIYVVGKRLCLLKSDIEILYYSVTIQVSLLQIYSKLSGGNTRVVGKGSCSIFVLALAMLRHNC